MENVADAVIEAIVMLRITAMPTLPRHPEHNGKVERLHGTITSMFLASLPGYTGGAKERDKTLTAGEFVLPLDVLLDELATWVRSYNCDRPHRSLRGLTPLEAWNGDPTPDLDARRRAAAAVSPQGPAAQGAARRHHLQGP